MTTVETDRERQLEDQVALLTQQLDALRGSNQELGVLIAVGYGMTHRLAEMLFILVKRAPAVVNRDTFHTIVYGDRSDGGPDPKIFNVHISRLRGVLQRVGCPGKIDTVWNAGFRADPKLVRWVQDKYDAQIPKE